MSCHNRGMVQKLEKIILCVIPILMGIVCFVTLRENHKLQKELYELKLFQKCQDALAPKK